MYIYKNGSKRRRDGWEVELAVPDVELEAALTTGGLIGTTGRKIRGSGAGAHSTTNSYLISTKCTLVATIYINRDKDLGESMK